MPLYLFILSHLACVGLGAGIMYFVTTRYTKVVDHEGHTALEIMTTEERMTSRTDGVRWPGLVLLGLGIIAVIIGVQVYLGQQNEEQNDKDDKAFISCIGTYSRDGLQDIVDTITIRNAANTKVEAAKTVRDDSVDDVIRIVALARATPPRATEMDFDRALKAATEAKIELRKAKAEAEVVKDMNEYEVKEPKCSR